MRREHVLPNLLTLKMASEQFGQDERGRPLVSVSVLRAEIRAGRLRCVRPTPGASSRILIDESELMRWLREVASRRQLGISPSDAAISRRAAAQVDSATERRVKQSVHLNHHRPETISVRSRGPARAGSRKIIRAGEEKL